MKRFITLVFLALALALGTGCVAHVDHSTATSCTDDSAVVLARAADGDSDIGTGASLLKDEASMQAQSLGCALTLDPPLPSAEPGVSVVPVHCCVDAVHAASDCAGIQAAVDACDSLVR